MFIRSLPIEGQCKTKVLSGGLLWSVGIFLEALCRIHRRREIITREGKLSLWLATFILLAGQVKNNWLSSSLIIFLTPRSIVEMKSGRMLLIVSWTSDKLVRLGGEQLHVKG
jgi:hypothetical protein